MCLALICRKLEVMRYAEGIYLWSLSFGVGGVALLLAGLDRVNQDLLLLKT